MKIQIVFFFFSANFINNKIHREEKKYIEKHREIVQFFRDRERDREFGVGREFGIENSSTIHEKFHDKYSRQISQPLTFLSLFSRHFFSYTHPSRLVIPHILPTQILKKNIILQNKKNKKEKKKKK
jgi:hypothetical protein